MKISVLGAGNMGTTLANMLAKKGYAVSLWTIEKEVFESVNRKHENTKYLPKVSLSSNISATMNLRESISGAEIVLLSVPSPVVRAVAKQAAEFITPYQIVIDAAKGLETGSNKLMSDIIKEELPNNPLIAIGGPSIANELAAEVPTIVIFASKDAKALKTAQKAFSTPHYKIYTTDDIVGVEVGGAFKNIVALLGGICDGLAFGPNTKSAFVTLGLAEISALAEKLGANPETLQGLAGLGDLFVTSTSPHSRNRTLGEKIGRGASLKEAQEGMVQVTEGVAATEAARSLAKKHKLDLPIIEMIYSILFEGESPRDAINEFMTKIDEA